MAKPRKIKKIFRKPIAIELRKLGFRIIGTEVNTAKPQFDVYLFEDTEKFQRALTKALNIYTATERNRK